MGELREHRSLPRIEPTSFGRDYYLVKARILASERDRYLISMNEIAAFYWRLLDGPRTVGELLDCLAAEYEVTDRKRAEADLCSLLEKWESSGFVELCD